MHYELNVEIPMRDNVVLRADIMRPDDDGPHPALLIRTPYSKDSPSTRCEDSAYPTEFAKAGYAVVVQDTRGRFCSDGEWGVLDWTLEGPDGYDTVEWIAAQPWCNGKVVMSGLSYPGTAALITGIEQPPHLAAIAACYQSEGTLDREALSGGYRTELFLPWFVYMLAQDVLPKHLAAGTATPEMVQSITEAMTDMRRVTDYLPIKKNPYLQIAGAPITVEQLLTQGVPVFDVERISVPTLLLGGWFDLFTWGTIELFRALRARGAGGDETRNAHRLIVGPWIHGTPHFLAGEMNFGVTVTADAAWRPALEAFHGGHSGLATPPPSPDVTYFLMGANEWRTATDWPPPGSAVDAWYLHSGGKANTAVGNGRLSADEPVADEPVDTYRYDPMRPVISRGGGALGMAGTVPGPVDQYDTEHRDDVLCYTSEPFDAPLDIVGEVRLRLSASSSAVDTDFVARLCDVSPTGRSINVCDGIRRARHRMGVDREVPLEPGKVEEFAVHLGHTAWRVLPGHRLRLQVTSSNFPNWDRNLNTGNGMGDDEGGVVADQTIHHSAQMPSVLEIDVLR